MFGFLRCVLTAALLGMVIQGSAEAQPANDLRAVDEAQRRMVAEGDAAGLARLALPNLRINAPGNRVLSRGQFLENMSNGEIAADQFERTAEDVSISGNVGVVMGRETFTPAAGSELGRAYGVVPLLRRYTNVYVRVNGRWLWLARHANVVPPPPASRGR